MNRSSRLAALAAAVLLAGSAARADAPARDGIDLWPLLVANDEETTVLYPLFVHEPGFTLVLPAYARTRDGRDHHLLWPLLKLSDGRLERAAPFWFRRGDGEFTLFPLVHQTRRGTLWLLPPIWLAENAPFQAVFPLYLHDGERWYVAPNFYLDDPPGDDLRVASLGLFDWERRGDERALSIALLARGSWGPEGRSALLLPVYGRVESPDEQLHWLGPVYSRKTPGRHARGVFPFVMRAQGGLDAAESHDRLSILWPLYTRSVSRDPDGAVVERERRFLLFRDALERDGSRRLELLGVPIWERTS